mmetsp:Transcript_16826/g.58554  ORF Transcript_16826/g.58554 Transcript_16826/m.58554 type:complete len:455 (-) Transcript_16826:898-2262(-)
MDILAHGYPIPFIGSRYDVPRSRARRNGPGCDQYANWLRGAIDDMVRVGAVRQVPVAPWVISAVNVIPKSTPGKFRLIVDLRKLNFYVARRAFKYETLATFRDMIEEGDFFASIDLESAYFHVDVGEADQTFFGFEVFAKMYVFCVLPFGLRDACYIFTKIMSVLVRRIREMGVKCLLYIDDFLLAQLLLQLATVTAVRLVFERLGFLINEPKSVFVPTQLIDSLGYSVDSVRMLFRLTARRIAKFDAAIADVLADLQSRGVVSARLVARVTGHIAAAALIFAREGRLRSQHLLDAVVDVSRDGAWGRSIVLEEAAGDELRRWRTRVNSDSSAPISRRWRGAATDTLMSDASDFACGGLRRSLRSDFGAMDSWPARGALLPHERELSSTYRELCGVRFVLASFAPQLRRGAVIDFQVDSLNAAQIHARGGSLRRGPDGSLYLHQAAARHRGLRR